MYQNFVQQRDLLTPGSPEKVSALVIPSVLDLQEWQGDVWKPGIYVDKKTQEVVIVQSFEFSDLKAPPEAINTGKTEKLSAGQHVVVTARARVVVSGSTARKGVVPLEDDTAISIPFRGPYTWAQYKQKDKAKLERAGWSQVYTTHTLGS